MDWQKWIGKYLPSREEIQNKPYLRWLAKYLHNEDIWSFQRHTVARGLAVGFLLAFIPLPIQFVLASLLAICVRGNLPLAVLTTLITNPFTFAPIYYGIFLIGESISGETVPYHALPQFDWQTQGLSGLIQHLFNWFTVLGKPLLIGIPVVAITCSLISYCLVYLIAKLMDRIKRD